jgi:hypothetical protein
MLLDELPRDLVDFLILPKLSLKDGMAVRGTCRALRNDCKRPILLIEGRRGSWQTHDLSAQRRCELVDTKAWACHPVFEGINPLVQEELARTGRGKSFCRKMVRVEEIVKTDLGVPNPSAMLDPRITRYYEELMFYEWQENNIGPRFKGIQIYPPGIEEEVHLWHNDAFELANEWDPNDPASFGRNAQLFSHMVVTVGRDFVVPLPPLICEKENDLVMTNYDIDLDSGMLVLAAHVRHNPLKPWKVFDLDLYAYLSEAHRVGMKNLERQFKHRVKAAHATTCLALRGHDIESLFEPHLVINLAVLEPIVRQCVNQLARTINAGTFLDGDVGFVQYGGTVTPPRIRLQGVDNVFLPLESLRPSVCMPGCYLIVHERPNRVIVVDSTSKQVSRPFPFPRGTGCSVIL